MAGAPAIKPHVPYAEYLELEEKSVTKHEWLDGVVYALEAQGMAGIVRGKLELAAEDAKPGARERGRS